MPHCRLHSPQSHHPASCGSKLSSHLRRTLQGTARHTIAHSSLVAESLAAARSGSTRLRWRMEATLQQHISPHGCATERITQRRVTHTLRPARLLPHALKSDERAGSVSLASHDARRHVIHSFPADTSNGMEEGVRCQVEVPAYAPSDPPIAPRRRRIAPVLLHIHPPTGTQPLSHAQPRSL